MEYANNKLHPPRDEGIPSISNGGGEFRTRLSPSAPAGYNPIRYPFAFTDYASFAQRTVYDAGRSQDAEFVGVDDYGEIVAAPGEERRIATILYGSTAVAVALGLPDGSRKGYILHCSTPSKSQGAEVLEITLRSVPSEVAFARVVVMTPGKWMQNHDSMQTLVVEDEMLTSVLKGVAYRCLGAEADIQVYPYGANDELPSRVYEQNTLMVALGLGGETTIFAESTPILPGSESI